MVMYGNLDPFARFSAESWQVSGLKSDQNTLDFTSFNTTEAFNTIGFNDGNTEGRAGTVEVDLANLERKERIKQDKAADGDDGWELYDQAREATRERLDEIERQIRLVDQMTDDQIADAVDRLSDKGYQESLKARLVAEGATAAEAAAIAAMALEYAQLMEKEKNGTLTAAEKARMEQIEEDPNYGKVKKEIETAAQHEKTAEADFSVEQQSYASTQDEPESSRAQAQRNLGFDEVDIAKLEERRSASNHASNLFGNRDASVTNNQKTTPLFGQEGPV